MRTTAAFLLIAAVIAGIGVLAQASGGASTINVGDNYFVRPSGVPTVSTAAGSKVTFRFIGRKAHQVAVKSGPSKFSAPNKSSGSYKSPALRKGTYVIYCKIHGQSDQSMKLAVK